MPLRKPLHEREAQACAHYATARLITTYEGLFEPFYVRGVNALACVEHIDFCDCAVTAVP